jgi:hypothetical protein
MSADLSDIFHAAASAHGALIEIDSGHPIRGTSDKPYVGGRRRALYSGSVWTSVTAIDRSAVRDVQLKRVLKRLLDIRTPMLTMQHIDKVGICRAFLADEMKT